MIKSISILGEVYKIQVIEGLAEAQGCEGFTDSSKYTIGLDGGLIANPRCLKRVLWHEIGHAFCFEVGLAEFLPEAILEMFCQSFSGMMCQIGSKDLFD